MAINQINTANFDYAMMLSVINLSYKTQADISITNYDNDSAPQVTAGSIFVNNGAQFENTTLATPTGYAGITNSTEFYLYYDESGGVFIYSNTAPTWSDAKQGLYNGNDKVFFSMYKDSGGTLYQNKNKYIGRYKERPMQIETQIKEETGTQLTANSVNDIDVTGFSFTPTAILDVKIYAWVYTQNEYALTTTDVVFGDSLFGGNLQSEIATTGKFNEVKIVKATVGTNKVTVRVATAANVFYRITVTAIRAV